jgi:hypothetical protein
MTNRTIEQHGDEHVAKTMTKCVGMDGLPGEVFEAGVANIKAIAEKQTEARAPDGEMASN